jgi:hypothetical protein
MSVLAAATAILLANSDFGIVSLSFYKDSCEKFLRSEPADQDMYVGWAAGHIKREFKIDLDTAALSQPLRSYCTAHPATTFADATAAVKDRLAGSTKP